MSSPHTYPQVLLGTLEIDRKNWEGRLGVLVRNLGTMKVVCWVNVSESSGGSSPGLSGIKRVKWLSFVPMACLTKKSDKNFDKLQ